MAVEQALNTAGGDGWSTTFAWSRQNWRSAVERRPPGRGERVRIFPGDLTPA